jgi:hypothetical protein
VTLSRYKGDPTLNGDIGTALGEYFAVDDDLTAATMSAEDECCHFLDPVMPAIPTTSPA